MGRLNSHSGTTSAVRPLFKAHYNKLIEEYASDDSLGFIPPVPDYLSYRCCQCGSVQKFKAEELSSIVYNAFRMSYAAQFRDSNFQEMIASRNQDRVSSDTDSLATDPSMNLNKHLTSVHSTPEHNSGVMNLHLSRPDSPAIRMTGNKVPPNSIPGLDPFSYKFAEENLVALDDSNQSTPTSDENNSPTELNSYKKLVDKPPLIKRIAFGITNGVMGSCIPDGDRITDDESSPLVPNVTGTSSRRSSFGYVNEGASDYDQYKSDGSSEETFSHRDVHVNHITTDHINRLFQHASLAADHQFESPRQTPHMKSGQGSLVDSHAFTPSPLTVPKYNGANTRRSAAEEAELKAAPWFQAGIPREITLEVLSQEPIGAFMVRESTSKPGCYALSVRVPRVAQPSGIAHYLIMPAEKGYKIKGFTKEFTTLTALITHHSVMQELLPCPLSLSRYTPRFENQKVSSATNNPNYTKLSDFHKMMADLHV